MFDTLSDLYILVFTSASVFLIVEAVFAILYEFRKKDKSTLSQATVWIRSLLMIMLAVIIMVFIKSTETQVVPIPS